MNDAAGALQKIAEARSLFVSRGDDSGTHTKEQALWKTTGRALAPRTSTVITKGKPKQVHAVEPADSQQWYLSIGQGMGKTLTFADE
jgi:tungstate transport system substrate-binding protein